MGRLSLRRLTPADRVIGALAFVSGSADVFAFLEFHEIFTSAMTGNTALLGLALGQGHLLAASRSLAALIGYSLGCVMATLIIEAMPPAQAGARVRRLIEIEIAGLALIAGAWTILPHPLHPASLYVLIGVASVSMGIQCIAARTIDMPGISTVVMTTTLTMIMIALTRRFKALIVRGTEPKRQTPSIIEQQIMTMALYIAGAALSGLLVLVRSDLVALPALLAAIIALIAAVSVQPAAAR